VYMRGIDFWIMVSPSFSIVKILSNPSQRI